MQMVLSSKVAALIKAIEFFQWQDIIILAKCIFSGLFQT